MKLKIILMISVIAIIISGCSKEKETTLVEDGKIALEEHNYKAAKELLSNALELDKVNEHARAMYIQALRMEDALKYEEKGNYEKAIEELEFIEKIKNGSLNIKNIALEKKEELTKLNEEYKIAQAARKENAKVVSSKDRYRVEEMARRENQKRLEALEAKKKKEEEDKKQQENELNQNIIESPVLQLENNTSNTI